VATACIQQGHTHGASLVTPLVLLCFDNHNFNLLVYS
jgi:hypothetical protein